MSNISKASGIATHLTVKYHGAGETHVSQCGMFWGIFVQETYKYKFSFGRLH